MYSKIAFPVRAESALGLLISLLMLVFLTSFSPATAAAPVTGLPQLQTAAPSGRIVVKLAASSGLVMDQEGLTVRPGAQPEANRRIQSVQGTLRSVLPGSPLEKRIPTAPVYRAESRSGNNLPDLALYGHLTTQGLSRPDLVKMAARLTAHPDIEVAFLEPVAVPAALGFDAFTGEGPPAPTRRDSPAAATPDFQDLQGYLQDAPLGVGALAMRPVAGQRGTGVTVIDVEGAWLWAHEDLPDPVADLGEHIDLLSWRNHGTAVIGEIRGIDNGFGVTGITPDCMVGNSSVGGAANTASALAAATEILAPGDLILIELHAPGPNSNGSGQFGYLPMEFWQDNFDAIRLAASKGIIVCEAAGNGYQNLDGPEYFGLFDRQVRNSGAIMCGATSGSELHAADFSNNGQRVDLNGWGWNVTTCGYGDLQSGAEEEYYTQQFSGTSSASPIVTGSVASLQGMIRQLHGFDLDAGLARDILLQTGTEMVSGPLIGNRPNLVEAFNLTAARAGQVIGTLTDLNSGVPLAGVMVKAGGGVSFAVSDEAGSWRLPLLDGPVTLEFSSFAYHSTSQNITITAGQTLVLDVVLEPLPRIELGGIVFAEENLTPLAQVAVTVTNQPVEGTVSGPSGAYLLADIPADHIYQLRFDGLPGFGAQVLDANTTGFSGPAFANPQLPVIGEDFETGGGGFVSAGGLWTQGEPPVAVTGGAFSGIGCWGIGMTGDYSDDEADQLLSPVYDLSEVTATSYRLSFHFYSATEPGFDGVNLEASDGGPFVVLHPLSGYTDMSLGGLDNHPGWAGDSGRWRGAVFDITDYLGGDFQFRLNWGSDGGVTGQGFFVDGIAFGSGQRVTPVPEDELPLPVATRLKAWPNPFNPRVTIEYALTKPGPLQIVVFDVRGRKVKTLLNQSGAQLQGSVEWDGKNDAGRQVASGVYFVRAVPRVGPSAVSRVVLSK